MDNSFFTSFKQWGIENLPERIYRILPALASALLVLIIGFWIAGKIGKLIVKLMDRHGIDSSIHRFIQRSVVIFLKIIVAVIALGQLGININSFITAMGAAGITAGLGLQNSIAQFAGGIQILFNKPFKSGDFVRVNDVEGNVKEIRFMYTTLQTLDNRIVIVPNQNIVTSNLINYTANDKRRVDMVFNISYKDNIENAKNILHNVATSNSFVDKTIKPTIAVKSHASSSIELTLYVWCDSANYWDTLYSVQEEVKIAFDKNGINIPFNQMDVHITTQNDK